MGKYRFSESEKVAVWTADGYKCLYDRTPVGYGDLQIDHIVPESTTEAQLLELRPFLPKGFQINSVENWATCHQGCNARKGAKLFDTNTLLFYLDAAKSRAAKVNETITSFGYARDNDKLLSTIGIRLEKGLLTREQVLAVVDGVSYPVGIREDPWVIAFGVNFYDALPIGAPEQDPELSSWLIQRLSDALTRTGAVFHFVDEQRTGETTSVRYAFQIFDFDRITESIDFCWEILAVQKYSELF